MKCDYKSALIKKQTEPITGAYEVARRMWEMSTLIALHREFGFGAKRLERATKAIREIYAEVDTTASRTDPYQYRHGSRPYSDVDSALISMVRELRSIGIDHRKLLGDVDLILIDESGKSKNVDDIVDRIEQHERMIKNV